MRCLILIVMCLLPLHLVAVAAKPAPTPIKEPYKPLKPVVIDKPTHVIGKGTPESVTFEALKRAVAAGGTIVFNTGGKPVTIQCPETLNIGDLKSVTIDGMGLVTLDGMEKTKLLTKEWKVDMTVQRLRFINARTDKEGAAINNTKWDGSLTVIDCYFENCKCTSDGPDIGGAIRATGQRHFQVSNCVFKDCAGSNGGAIVNLGSQVSYINCLFENCHAFGNGGGLDAGPRGQGGIGGAIYNDGVSQNGIEPQFLMANCTVRNCSAGDHAGAVFAYTVPDTNSRVIIDRCIFDNNVVKDTAIHMGWPSGMYTQYASVDISYCIFSNGKNSKGAGPFFASTPFPVNITSSDFYGNQPSRISSPDERTTMTDVKYQARINPKEIGYQDGGPSEREKAELAKKKAKEEKERKRAERKAAREAKKKAQTINLSDEVLKEYQGLLQTRTIAAASEKRKPRFYFSMMRGEVELVAASEDSATMRTKGTDMKINIWRKLKAADAANIAVAVAKSEQDFAVAGFYLLASGDKSKASKMLNKAGEHAAKVRGLFP